MHLDSSATTLAGNALRGSERDKWTETTLSDNGCNSLFTWSFALLRVTSAQVYESHRRVLVTINVVYEHDRGPIYCRLAAAQTFINWFDVFLAVNLLVLSTCHMELQDQNSSLGSYKSVNFTQDVSMWHVPLPL